MQTRDRYWEGLYWDGFAPDAIGAVALRAARCEDAAVARALEGARARAVDEKLESAEPLFVTAELRAPLGARPRAVAVRLWPLAVFLGARDSGSSTPGEGCRDWLFDAGSGRFLAEQSFDESEAEAEAFSRAHGDAAELAEPVELSEAKDAAHADAAGAAAREADKGESAEGQG
jgi:hypothetical protein